MVRLGEKYSSGIKLGEKVGGGLERLGDKTQKAGKLLGLVHKEYGKKLEGVGEAISATGGKITGATAIAEGVGGIAGKTGQIAGDYSKLPTRGFQRDWKTVGLGALTGLTTAGPLGAIAGGLAMARR